MDLMSLLHKPDGGEAASGYMRFYGVILGFKHIFWEGNTCPDIHLSISETRKHWRETPSSSTKHQLCFPLEMGACVAEVDASGCG